MLTDVLVILHTSASHKFVKFLYSNYRPISIRTLLKKIVHNMSLYLFSRDFCLENGISLISHDPGQGLRIMFVCISYQRVLPTIDLTDFILKIY